MAFVSHEEGIERTLALVESERGEKATHLQLLISARMLAAEVRKLQRIGATGQLKVTEEWTQLPGTDVEIRLRYPMRSGFVGYRQRWPRDPDATAGGG